MGHRLLIWFSYSRTIDTVAVQLAQLWVQNILLAGRSDLIFYLFKILKLGQQKIKGCVSCLQFYGTQVVYMVIHN